VGGVAPCGPNVFLDCTATRPYGVSEPYTTLAAGVLYDNVQAPLAFRFNASTLPRWMGLQNVMWNCAGMFLVQQPPEAQNYSIGHTGLNAMLYNRDIIDYSLPEGCIESLDEKAAPRSLYLKQLEDRLGKTVKSE